MDFFFKKKPEFISPEVEELEERLHLGGHSILVRRKPRLRTLSLSVYADGRLVLKCGMGTKPSELMAFFIKNESWIEARLEKFRKSRERFPPKKFESGEMFPLHGRDCELKIFRNTNRSWRVERSPGGALIVRVPHNFKELFSRPEDLRARGLESLRDFYKDYGSGWLRGRMEFWSQSTGLFPRKLSFRSQKTLWGSCNSRGHISLNWRIVAFPPEVADYVMVHELCHLTHQDHSSRFWSLVEHHMPQYRDAKRWLRENQNLVEFLGK